MKLKKTLYFLLGALLLCGFTMKANSQSAYKISAPYTYKNLTVFLIYGNDAIKGGKILTLQEAMDKRLFVVYETSDVNQLVVENFSKDYSVFIQSGDIVKGGKQDRVLAVSVIIPPRSGRIMIDAYCVEHGRWTKRGSEDNTKFGSSNDRIVSKELKIAANQTRSQNEVWDEVSKAQEKLSQNVGGKVNSPTSATSLQLALENEKVTATVDDYVKKLSGITAGKTNVIGYAFVVNGEINSADIYASNDLFGKLWLKMLKASATEAVSELKGAAASNRAVKPAEIDDFITGADRAATSEERRAAGNTTVITRDKKDAVVFEARDEANKAAVHKSYVKKN